MILEVSFGNRYFSGTIDMATTSTRNRTMARRRKNTSMILCNANMGR